MVKLRMVLISTDKAVNPTNIMGATKRAAEMIIQTINEKGSTESLQFACNVISEVMAKGPFI